GEIGCVAGNTRPDSIEPRVSDIKLEGPGAIDRDTLRHETATQRRNKDGAVGDWLSAAANYATGYDAWLLDSLRVRRDELLAGRNPREGREQTEDGGKQGCQSDQVGIVSLHGPPPFGARSITNST